MNKSILYSLIALLGAFVLSACSAEEETMKEQDSQASEKKGSMTVKAPDAMEETSMSDEPMMEDSMAESDMPAEPMMTDEPMMADDSMAMKKMTESDRLNAYFAETFEEDLVDSPESLSYLGRSDRQSEWDDISDYAANKYQQTVKNRLEKLATFNYKQLDDDTKVSYLLYKKDLEDSIEDHEFRHHSYPVNQMFGLHSTTPTFLINVHSISSVEDAEAYINRLKTLSVKFVDLVIGLRTRQDKGILPPKFVFPYVINDSENIISGYPLDDSEEENVLYADFSKKLDGVEGISASVKQSLLDQTAYVLQNHFVDSYLLLIDNLKDMRRRARNDAGVWKFPNGEAFYNNRLKRITTTDLTADEIHNIGLSEVERIHGEMEKIVKVIGYDGDLKDFFEHVRESDEYFYADNEEGRLRYLKETQDHIDAMKVQLPKYFGYLPKAELEVKRVEKFREDSAGKAFYNRPAPDGSRPGIYYVNLGEMRDMPPYQMEALAYHEALPGHHMQIAIAQELEHLPLFRKFSFVTAYTEGWGLYSEYIPKEMGFYKDPMSDFGRLAMELWRACRLVVDTGIHAKRWDREDGIDYYVENTPNAETDAVSMVERHIVMPGQATAYKIGMLKILDLRDRAESKLGRKFDIREFHDQVLKNGAIPLTVLERLIDEWIADKQAS